MSVEVLKTNKEWLIWARESLNYSKKNVARKLKVSEDTITRWEETGELTNDELNSLSEIYHQNPALFFNLNNPGKVELIEDYRKLDNKDLELDTEILLEIRKSRLRRRNLLDIELEDPTLRNIEFKFKDYKYTNPKDCLNFLKSELNISKAKIERYSINDWITIVENLGVLVFQFYNFKVETLRGYSIYYDKLPIIALNHRESNNGKKFTLINGLIHLLLRKDGLSNLQSYNLEDSEAISTKITCNLLIPENTLEGLIKEDKTIKFCNDTVIKEYAKKLHTTEESIVRQFLNLTYITKEEYAENLEDLEKYINYKPVKKTTEKKEVEKRTNTTINPTNRFKRQASQKITENGRYYMSRLFKAYENNIITDLDLSNNLDTDLNVVNFIKTKYYKI